jgi:hypothetical protein
MCYGCESFTVKSQFLHNEHFLIILDGSEADKKICKVVNGLNIISSCKYVGT